jgi:hypothetical protein
MFDWERDQDEIRLQRPAPPPPPPPPPAPPRGWQGQWLSPVAAGGTLLLGLAMFKTAEPPPPPTPVSIAAFGGTPLPELRPATPGIVLQVYDAAQAARFVGGLARFDTPALLVYAAQTRADIALRNQPMTADLHDALTLIEAEIARRATSGGG